MVSDAVEAARLYDEPLGDTERRGQAGSDARERVLAQHDALLRTMTLLAEMGLSATAWPPYSQYRIHQKYYLTV